MWVGLVIYQISYAIINSFRMRLAVAHVMLVFLANLHVVHSTPSANNLMQTRRQPGVFAGSFGS